MIIIIVSFLIRADETVEIPEKCSILTYAKDALSGMS